MNYGREPGEATTTSRIVGQEQIGTMPEGEGTTTTTTTTPPENATPPDGATAPTTATKSFTQDELEFELGKRLARERAKYGDVDELKRKASEFDRLSEAQKTELEKAVDGAKRETEKTVRADERSKWTGVLRRAEVRVAAAGKLADPEDAVRFLDIETFEVDDEGRVDEKAVAAAIDRLVEEKPYLAAGTAPRTTKPGSTDPFDAGTRTSRQTTIPLNGDPLEADLRRKLGIT